MGLQGYSSPTENHVVFAVNKDMLSVYLSLCAAWPDLRCMEEDGYFEGFYRGVSDGQVFVLPEPLFNEVDRRWPAFLSDQESVLVLGTPQAMNHRPATLRFRKNAVYEGQDVAPGTEISLGMWVETTSADCRGLSAYTRKVMPGKVRYWKCVKNPSDCRAEDEHRELTEVMFNACMVLGGIVASRTTICASIKGDQVDMPYSEYVSLYANRSSYGIYNDLFNKLLGRRRPNGDVCTAKYLVQHGCK